MASEKRRDFVKKTMLSLGAIPFIGYPESLWALNKSEINNPLSVNIFSKHLQFLDFKELGEKALEIGFSGVDLTVRPGGHVLPEQVKTELPKALKAIRASGCKCNMITTSIESVKNPLDVDILQTASQHQIQFYRTNWFKYLENQSMEDSLLFYQKEIENLGSLNKELGIVGCYQNHAGRNVGASFWEIENILKTADTNFFGTQYDIRHAMVEGGFSWENGLQLLRKHIKVMVLKDFRWEKVNGTWEAVNVPMGEGMVDFDKYFKLLKKYNLKPPVSLHLEYSLGGAEKGNREITVDKKVVYDAMKKDLNEVQRLWQNA